MTLSILSFSHSEPNIATAFGRRSRRKVIAEQRTASSRLFIISFCFGLMSVHVTFTTNCWYCSWSWFVLLLLMVLLCFRFWHCLKSFYLLVWIFTNPYFILPKLDFRLISLFHWMFLVNSQFYNKIMLVVMRWPPIIVFIFPLSHDRFLT